MLVLDARGEILDINNRALEMLNLNEEEIIGVTQERETTSMTSESSKR